MAEEYSWRWESRLLAAESSRPLSFSVRRAAIEPTIATSRPSRIQTVASPMKTIQWKREQGSRSSRAGTRVSMVPSYTFELTARVAVPGDGVE